MTEMRVGHRSDGANVVPSNEALTLLPGRQTPVPHQRSGLDMRNAGDAGTFSVRQTRVFLFMVLGLAVGLVTPATVIAQDSRHSLDTAAAALGVDRLQTLQVSGRGADFLFGQAYDADSAWPRFTLPSYRLTIDYRAAAVREERTRTQGENPPRGGGNQPIAEQRQVWSGTPTIAWNGDGASASPAGRERDDRPAVEARQMWIWLTPHGFINAARTSRPQVSSVQSGSITKTRITFAPRPGLTLTGTLNAQGLLERIETWLPSPVLGDTLFETVFHDYRNVDGVQVPTRIIHREGGYPILDVTLTDILVNPEVRIEVPATIATAASRAEPLGAPAALAPGVWSVPLGPRDRSVAVEFRDHIIVIEAPTSEAISVAGIAAIKSVIPGKPIRYIVNTHLHFDHSGGLRTYVAEGATVVTHRDNVAFFQQAWANRRTLAPDVLSATGRTASFDPVVGSRTYSDGERTLVVYHYASDMHHPGMLMVHLPAEKIVIEADSFNPPNRVGEEPNAMPNLVQFAGEVARLRLEVEQIVPVHGRLTTLDEAQQAIERFGDLVLWPRPETQGKAGRTRQEGR